MTDTVDMQTHGIRPYRVEDSGRGLHRVLADVNRNCCLGYGPDLGAAPPDGRIVVDTLVQYEHLLRRLAAVPRLEFVRHQDLFARGCPADRILCALRHDVDADIRAAVAEAEIERRHGACSTYFVLHTAPYHGVFDDDGVFRRNGSIAIPYRRLQDLGHEVALHTDPLGVYQEHRVDGAAAVETELAWLREQGLEIRGTVAHNSAPVYGIENFAIFRGRNRHGFGHGGDGGLDEELSEIVHHGRWAPLGVLDERELGLEYEGNDLFHQKDAPLSYGATRSLNRWRWNDHLRRLDERPDITENRFIDQARLLDEIDRLEPGRWLMLNVHPLYYGARHATTSAPTVRLDTTTTRLDEERGWESYEPGATIASHGDAADGPERQSINVANAAGMLDWPESAQDAEAWRGLILGGDNLDGRTVGMPEHAHLQAAQRLTEATERPVRLIKRAFPGMGFTRHYAWWDAATAQESMRLRVVIIGLGADVLDRDRPDGWARTTGFAPSHPPGAYLRYDGNAGAVEVVPSSPGAAIRRATPASIDDPLSLVDDGVAAQHASDLAGLAACLRFYADAVRDRGGVPLVLLDECGESVGLWREDVTPETRRAGHARARAALDELVAAAGIDTVIDPYLAMLEPPAPLPAHWQSAAEWNFTGHRLVASALTLALVSRVSAAGVDDEREVVAPDIEEPPAGR